MSSALSLWIVIPAYNEASVIAGVLEELHAAAAQWSTLRADVVVTDDCSSDNTCSVVRRFPVHLCRHVVNLGQGAALQTGIDYALQNGADIVVTYDSDGQHTPDSISKLVEPLINHEAEIALGTRFASGASAENISASKTVTLKSAVLFTRITTGLEITDTHNGLRAFTRLAAQKIRITQNRMAHASEILSEIARSKLPYKEVPVRIRYTEYSMAKGQKIGNALNILWESFFGKVLR